MGTLETNSTFGGQDVPGRFRTPQAVESVSDGRISLTSDFPPYQQPAVSSRGYSFVEYRIVATT